MKKILLLMTALVAFAACGETTVEADETAEAFVWPAPSIVYPQRIIPMEENPELYTDSFTNWEHEAFSELDFYDPEFSVEEGLADTIIADWAMDTKVYSFENFSFSTEQGSVDVESGTVVPVYINGGVIIGLVVYPSEESSADFDWMFASTGSNGKTADLDTLALIDWENASVLPKEQELAVMTNAQQGMIYSGGSSCNDYYWSANDHVLSVALSDGNIYHKEIGETSFSKYLNLQEWLYFLDNRE